MINISKLRKLQVELDTADLTLTKDHHNDQSCSTQTQTKTYYELTNTTCKVYETKERYHLDSTRDNGSKKAWTTKTVREAARAEKYRWLWEARETEAEVEEVHKEDQRRTTDYRSEAKHTTKR